MQTLWIKLREGGDWILEVAPLNFTTCPTADRGERNPSGSRLVWFNCKPPPKHPKAAVRVEEGALLCKSKSEGVQFPSEKDEFGSGG